ncbi:MAG: ferrous iron transport protein B [Candidatus Marinimicrobia bacterium]|nr:ferrous iron transport protein B [Candidatus Neomarinimicrobiota bacterium]
MVAGKKIAIAGNPNSGKTTIFNALTGARQHVGNWPGVTVERKEGKFSFEDVSVTVLDLPGTYSLASYSIEETIARSYIIDEHPDVVVNIVDAANLQRNLFLTTQLIELGAPLVVVLNMMDMADEKGLEINIATLSVLLGVPVVKMIGRTGQGLGELKQAIARVATAETDKREIKIPYPRELEEEISSLTNELAYRKIARGRLRWRAVKLFERDKTSTEKLAVLPDTENLLAQIEVAIQRIEGIYKETSRAIISHARYGFIQGALRECVRQTKTTPSDYSRRIDKVLTNKWLGLPVFAALLWLMFQLTYTIGAYPMDWIDSGVAWLMSTLGQLLPAGMLSSLIVDGIIGGVGAIAVFLPNIFILFFVIALLEDSGYMARVAFIMDRVMHSIGLHGKAFIPMIMGFGCNVPAIMGTRILESRRDRILSILINPFMSCSARFPVYVLVAGAFFPQQAGTVIFSLYVLGILVAIGSGKLFSRTILTGLSRPFVMELPPYQQPTARSLILHTWERGVIFIRKMGTVILAGSILIWALGYFPRNVSLSKDYSLAESKILQQSMVNQKEIDLRFEQSVASSHDCYSSLMIPFDESSEYQLLVRQKSALHANISANRDSLINDLRYERMAETVEQKWIGRLGKFIVPVVEPLGFTWRESVALVTGFVAKEIVVSTYGVLFGVGSDVTEENVGIIENLRKSGLTPLVALAFLVFTLLYTPCLATVAVIKRETGSWGYTAFSVIYSLILAWLLAFGIYQIGSLLL